MKHLVILGNGFSLDLMHHLSSETRKVLSNLAAYGDRVSWPTGPHAAFISFQNTPNMWILGVRPNGDAEQNNQIIENIITCANAYFLRPAEARKGAGLTRGRIYIEAYRELVVYLKYLFITLDEMTRLEKTKTEEWAWGKFLRAVFEDSAVDSVDIVTFNYDLWLERALGVMAIPYNTEVLGSQRPEKVRITKPHGSISFVHKARLDDDAFSINHGIDYLDGETSDFDVRMDDLKVNSPIIPLIPPSGDSDRFKASWAGQLRKHAQSVAQSLDQGDRVVLCGMSYWHVDRGEIDELLLSVPSSIDVVLINPSPPPVLDAVLASLFDNYKHYSSMSNFMNQGRI